METVSAAAGCDTIITIIISSRESKAKPKESLGLARIHPSTDRPFGWGCSQRTTERIHPFRYLFDLFMCAARSCATFSNIPEPNQRTTDRPNGAGAVELSDLSEAAESSSSSSSKDGRSQKREQEKSLSYLPEESKGTNEERTLSESVRFRSPIHTCMSSTSCTQ